MGRILLKIVWGGIKENRNVCKYLKIWESEFKIVWEGKEHKKRKKRKMKMFLLEEKKSWEE